MVEITVKAADSASAMEEIEKRLGADAMIVSTNRVDGQIEIVATNDDPSKYQKTPEPLVLDKNYRIKGFSDVLNAKLSVDDKPLKSDDKPLKNVTAESHRQIAENAENIKVEIDKLVELSTHSNPEKDNDTSVHELFQMSGIKKSLIENIDNPDSSPSIEDASKILAKSFIHGKCDHFESSSLYLVMGNAGAGKTLFSKKLKTLFETQTDAKSCTLFGESNVKKSITEIKSWFAKNKSKIIEKKKIGIIELSNEENIDDFLLNFSKLKTDIKISILNLVPVGNSYEYLIKNMPQRRLENEYLALTKLDLCDLSILEIAAFVELNHKCMFFSGVPSSEEGLYFAKVGQTVDHIVQTIENRMD